MSKGRGGTFLFENLEGGNFNLRETKEEREREGNRGAFLL